ncbi:MAG: circadian clock KaiB family protein [Oscillatoriales cyanobacterium C42_A2020_001]|nr:circadian clock KaiB family protein [Leptolyngbyaceae cyanobacterium C42_A2020_001]
MESSPLAFKGIALFTPGGDVVYCIDPHKQIRWHIHLCEALQHLLGLAELPHFLVPCYTATVDRSVDSATQQISQVAEASPLVSRYQPLLNAIFATPNLVWQQTQPRSTVCDPIVLATYRSQFPQLWQSHDLVVRYEQTISATPFAQPSFPAAPLIMEKSAPQGYVLRLFVSGHSSATQRTLQKLHTLLEQTLDQPYTLKVIDVAQHPEQAEQDQVTATPTLVRAYPLPMLRIVGSLENVDQLLGLLRVLDE